MKGYAFEKALKFLAKQFPDSEKKPAFYHSLRVGVFLWNIEIERCQRLAKLIRSYKNPNWIDEMFHLTEVITQKIKA